MTIRLKKEVEKRLAHQLEISRESLRKAVEESRLCLFPGDDGVCQGCRSIITPDGTEILLPWECFIKEKEDAQKA